MTLKDPQTGVGLRFIKQYDIQPGQRVTRIDRLMAMPRLPWWTRLRIGLRWLRNRYAPQQIARRYMLRKGWVVMWLDEGSRICNQEHDICWIQTYEDGRKGGLL